MSTILVTGGSGCVGQHIIKLFNKHADDIDEIRILDLQKYEQKLEFENKIKTSIFCGSINDSSLLERVTKGVNCFIHTAAYVDVNLFPNNGRLDLVNRKGTQMLLEACYKNSVELFLYCSTIDVMQGYEDIVNGNEENTKPDRLLFGNYAKTKQAAEKAVLKSNGRKLNNGAVMRTVSLRPMVIYGELDSHFVSTALSTAIKNGKVMVDFSGNGLCCVQYVGNVAWAFVCAYKAMEEDTTLGGEAFLIKDNTPNSSMMQFCKPYFDTFGVKMYRSYLPYWVVYFLIYLVQMLLFVISPIKRVQFPFTTWTFIYMNLSLSFDGSKAETMLKYKPLFSSDESQRRSLDYYKSLNFQDKKIK